MSNAFIKNIFAVSFSLLAASSSYANAAKKHNINKETYASKSDKNISVYDETPPNSHKLKCIFSLNTGKSSCILQ